MDPLFKSPPIDMGDFPSQAHSEYFLIYQYFPRTEFLEIYLVIVTLHANSCLPVCFNRKTYQ